MEVQCGKSPYRSLSGFVDSLPLVIGAIARGSRRHELRRLLECDGVEDLGELGAQQRPLVVELGVDEGVAARTLAAPKRETKRRR